jgi:hypothetical protein
MRTGWEMSYIIESIRLVTVISAVMASVLNSALIMTTSMKWKKARISVPIEYFLAIAAFLAAFLIGVLV